MVRKTAWLLPEEAEIGILTIFVHNTVRLGGFLTGTVYESLTAYLKQNEPLIERKGTLRAAFTYALNQYKYIRVFLSDGDVLIDNNTNERAIRGFCIGRKNW